MGYNIIVQQQWTISSGKNGYESVWTLWIRGQRSDATQDELVLFSQEYTFFGAWSLEQYNNPSGTLTSILSYAKLKPWHFQQEHRPHFCTLALAYRKIIRKRPNLEIKNIYKNI